MSQNLLKNVYQHPLLNDDELKVIFGMHTRTIFQKGEMMLKEGDTANGYFILQSGLMRSFVHDFNGNDITTNFFVPGEIVIEVSSLFQRIPTQENIQALVDCVCWKIDFSDFQNLFHTISGFSEWGRTWMAQSLFESKQRAISIITDSATERYQKLLEEKPFVLQNTPLKYIASYLGITDSSLSRIRKETAKL